MQNENEEKEEGSEQQQGKMATVISLVILGVLVFSFTSLMVWLYYTTPPDTFESVNVWQKKHDRRQYKFLKLSNHIQVLLISDNKTHVGAAAMSVGVGSYQQPNEFPGLAHFLEHMLFRGSRKYPDQYLFSDFIKKNGGIGNAYTSWEETNFYFSLPIGVFEEGLNIFSRFFIDSLMSEDSVEKEINAIQSEYENSLSNSAKQELYLLQKFANPDHPFSKFRCGNKETLIDIPESKGLNTYEALHSFYNSTYSSNLMNLVIISDQNMLTLEDWVSQKFSGIKNTDKIIDNSFQQLPILKNNTGILVKQLSSSKDIELNLFFVLNESISKIQTMPEKYIIHLLGHDGPKSLSSYLKKKMLIHSLSAFSFINCYSFNLLEVQMILTEKGFSQIQEILKIFFTYIKLLKQQGIKKTTYENLAKISKLQFSYEDQPPVSEQANTYASNMRFYPLNYSLSGSSFFEVYNKTLIRELLSQISPRNALIFVNNPLFEDPQSNNKNEDEKSKEKKENETDNKKENEVSKEQKAKEDKGKDDKNQKSSNEKEDAKEDKVKQDRFLINIQEEFEKLLSNKRFRLKILNEIQISQDSQITKFFSNSSLTEYDKIGNQYYSYQKLSEETFIELENLNKDDYKDGLKTERKNKFLSEIHDLKMIKTCPANQELLTNFLQIQPSKMKQIFSNQKSKIFLFGNNITTEDCAHQNLKFDYNIVSPSQVQKTENYEIWYKLDRSYQKPQVAMKFSLESKIAWKSIDSMIKLKLMENLIQDDLQSELYDAVLIGYIINIEDQYQGLDVEIIGLSDKIGIVVQTVMDTIINLKHEEEQIEAAKEEIKQQMLDELTDVKSQVKSYFGFIMIENSYLPSDLLKLLDNITLLELQEFQQEFLKEIYLQVLIIGNILEKDAVSLIQQDIIAKLDNLSPVKEKDLYINNQKIANLINISTILRIANANEKDENSLIMNYYQYGDINYFNLKDYIGLQILDQIVTSQAYSILRADMQLGYIAMGHLTQMDLKYGIIILIQGVKNLPDKNDLIIDYMFLQKMESALQSFDNNEFMQIKKSVYSNLIGREASLENLANKMWKQIKMKTYQFELNNQLHAQLESFEKEDLLEIFRKIFIDNQTKLSLQIFNIDSQNNITKSTTEAHQSYNGKKSNVFFKPEEMKEFIWKKQ